MAEPRLVYDCSDNPPPKLGQIGNAVFEKTRDKLVAPFDEPLFQRAAEQTHEVYRTYRHYAALRHFALKHGVIIEYSGHWHLDILRLQEVCACMQRKTEPAPPMDPRLRLNLLRRNRPFKTALGEALKLHPVNQNTTAQPAPNSEATHPMSTKRFVLYLTPAEYKAWIALKNGRTEMPLGSASDPVVISVVNRLLTAGHLEELTTETAENAVFRFKTRKDAFHVQPIEERKTRHVAEHWFDLIERLFRGEFSLPKNGSITNALNAWAHSLYPHLGKNSAYVMFVGFDPTRKYDRLGMLFPDPNRKSRKSGEFLFAVRGFAPYEFAGHQATETATTETPEPPKPQAQTEAPPAEPAKTFRSTETVFIKLFDETAIAAMDDTTAEKYLNDINAALESLNRHLKVVEAARAQAIENEIKRLEDEAMERMQRVEQLKKRLPQQPSAQVSNSAAESPTS